MMAQNLAIARAEKEQLEYKLEQLIRIEKPS
jgi:hypothetical protein